MKKTSVFPTSEFVFREDDGSYYAVSLSFGLFAEGETAEEAMTHLQHATIGYLMMCLAEEESEEQIYRGAPKKYIDMYNESVGNYKKPTSKMTKKKAVWRTSKYQSDGSLVVAS